MFEIKELLLLLLLGLWNYTHTYVQYSIDAIFGVRLGVGLCLVVGVVSSSTSATYEFTREIGTRAMGRRDQNGNTQNRMRLLTVRSRGEDRV